MYFPGYYRYMLPNTSYCDCQFWFLMHFPVMLGVSMAALFAFLLALIYERWGLVSISSPYFVHMLFGLLTIGLSLMQVR